MTIKKYHTNQHGVTSICPANIQCRLKDIHGNPVQHHHTAEEAHAAFERMMEEAEGNIATFTKDDLPGERQAENSATVPAAFTESELVVQADFEAGIERIFKNNPDLRAMAEEQEQALDFAKKYGKPLSGKTHAKRTRYIERVLDEIKKEKLTTDFSYTVNTLTAGKIYTPERTVLHNDIIDSWLDTYEDVQCQGRVLFAGGLGGAGKSTVLAEKMGIQENDYATLNPDDIKEDMAERNMIPYVPGLTPMEASPIVHDEASRITKELQDHLAQSKKNILFDTTLSTTETAEKKIRNLLDYEYKTTDIFGVFVDISPDTALQRAKARHRAGVNEYTMNKGVGSGGRYLPEEIIDKQRPADGSKHHSKNAENIVALEKSGWLSSVRVFNNNVDGAEPVEIPYEEFSQKSLQ